ncbi:hypothetical protein Tco_0708566 [Tanacetum coccineum]
MGPARSGILGEATVNIARYYSSSRSPATVSLPVEEMQLWNSFTGQNPVVEGSKYSGSNPEEEAADEDYDDAGSRSLGSEASPNLSAKSASSQDMPPTSLLGRIKIMKIFPFQSQTTRHSQSEFTHDEQEQEYSDSPSPVPPTTSLMNATSSKNLLEAAEDTIEELRDEAKLWERRAQKLMLDLEILKEKFSDQSKCLADSQMELSAAQAERDGMKKEVDHIKMLLKESVVKQKATMESNSTYKSEDKRFKEGGVGENVTIEEDQKLLEDYNLKFKELESLIAEQEAQIADTLKKHLRNDFMVLRSSVDSQVSANKLLEEKAKELEKVNGELELRLFEMEENVKLIECVSDLEKVEYIKNVEKLLLDAQEECEYVKSEKDTLQESAKNLIEECNSLQNYMKK